MTAQRQSGAVIREAHLRYLTLEKDMQSASADHRRRGNRFTLHQFVRAARDAYLALGEVYLFAGLEEDARRWTMLANTRCRDEQFRHQRLPKPTPELTNYGSIFGDDDE